MIVAYLYANESAWHIKLTFGDSENAEASIEPTLLGREITSRFLLLAKTNVPIFFTPSSITTLFKETISLKADIPMSIIEEGTFNSFR